MTVSECYAATERLLGDCPPPSLSLVFPDVANRAVMTLARYLPDEKTKEISHFPTCYRGETPYTVEDEDFDSFSPNPLFPPIPHRIEGNVIILPNTAAGKFRLTYKKKLSKITAATENVVLPFPEEGAILLPLLIASELLYDADADKAAYYYSLFRTSVSELTDAHRRYTRGDSYTGNGW